MDRSALHRRASALLLASAMAWLSGFAQPGPLARRGTMIGTLKSEVAQLESEKDQARREVAELRTENKRIEAQLAEIESENGDLATRLDDARAVISRQGLDSGTLAPPSRTATDSNRRASPIRSQSKGRKTPMAEIPREAPEPPGQRRPPPRRSGSAPSRSTGTTTARRAASTTAPPGCPSRESRSTPAEASAEDSNPAFRVRSPE